MKKLVCTQCGGTNIETKAWVDANDDTVLDSAVIDEQDNFCRDCQKNVKFDEKEFPDQSKEKLVCEKCHGLNVESLRWEDPNTGIGIPFEGITKNPISWCNDCHTNVILKSST